MPNSDQSIAILGGGICGLCTAYALNKNGFDVTVYEQDKTAGGKIKSSRKDNWLVEQGPNTVMAKTQEIWNFLDDLNLNHQLIEANPKAQKRYIVRNGQLHAVPSSLLQFLRTDLFSTPAKLRLLKEPFIRPTAQHDETLASFIRRRLGNEPLQYGINPFVAGVYAGDPNKLSVKHTFSTLFEMEQKQGSIFKGMIKKEKKKTPQKALISFKKGLQGLPQRLTKRLGRSLKTDAEVTAVRKNSNGWQLTLNGDDKKHQTYSNIISTLPPAQLTQIWHEPTSAGAINKLSAIEYAPISVLALGFRETQIDHPLDGFGLLVPEKERFSLLGTLFSSTLFPNRAPENHVLLTCFVGGMRQPNRAQHSTKKLKAMVLKDLDRLIGIEGTPVFTQHAHHARAIPQFDIGYDDFLAAAAQIERENPGFYIHGNFIAGISVPDCITASLKMAKRFVEK